MSPLTIRLVVRNRHAVTALVRSAEAVAAAAQEMPWREDLAEAARDLRLASACLVPTTASLHSPPDAT